MRRAFPIEYVRHDRIAPELGEIWWQGRQWAVTADGIERLDGGYFIEKEQLDDAIVIGGELIPAWPKHLGAKIWLDHDDFATAFLTALSLHGFTAGSVFSHKALTGALRLLQRYRTRAPDDQGANGAEVATGRSSQRIGFRYGS